MASASEAGECLTKSMFDWILYVPVNNFSAYYVGTGVTGWNQYVIGKDLCVFLKDTRQ